MTLSAFIEQLQTILSQSEKSGRQAAFMALIDRHPPETAAYLWRFLFDFAFLPKIKQRVLHHAVLTAALLPDWLYEACYEQCQDHAEALALVLPHGSTPIPTVQDWLTEIEPVLIAHPDELNLAGALVAVLRSMAADGLPAGGVKAWLIRRYTGVWFRWHQRFEPQQLWYKRTGLTDTVDHTDIQALTAGLQLKSPPFTETVSEKKPPLYNINTVLMYVDYKAGRSWSNYCELAFGVWVGQKLQSVCKIQASQIPQPENTTLKTFVQKNTLKRAGSVAIVRACLVVKVAFAGVLSFGKAAVKYQLESPVFASLEPDLLPDQVPTGDDLKRYIEVI